jgi:hypothetical protein
VSPTPLTPLALSLVWQYLWLGTITNHSLRFPLPPPPTSPPYPSPITPSPEGTSILTMVTMAGK